MAMTASEKLLGGYEKAQVRKISSSIFKDPSRRKIHYTVDLRAESNVKLLA